MAVSYINTTDTLTGPGTYVVDTTSGELTITLPLLSAVGADGMVIVVIRDGSSNAVIVQRQGSDVLWDASTTRTLAGDNAVVKLVARNGGSVWYETGTFRTVT